MKYEEYQGPEIQDPPRRSGPPRTRAGSTLAMVGNVLAMLYFTLAALGFWMVWREEGETSYYYGIFAFAAMAVLAFPPLGTLLERRLGRRASRWIRWGGCAAVFLYWSFAFAA